MMNTNNQHYDALQDRFGLKVIASLNEQALPHEISERLRVSRQQAMSRRPKLLVTQQQTASHIGMSGGAATLDGSPFDDGSSWLNSIVSALPLIALVAGLILANNLTNEQSAREIADVDVLLLTDDLPPAAHTDPGFVQYLKFGPP